MIQTVKNSVFRSSENIASANIAGLRAIEKPNREGVQIIVGHSNALDGGGGIFIWNADIPIELDDNGVIIAPDGAQPGDTGCWFRVITSIYASLAWFGSDDRSTGNLLEQYGYDGIVVNITEDTKGGFFQFNSAEVINHDGVNNFNGWVRINDPNFLADLKLNQQRATGASPAQGSSDLTTLGQVLELVQSGGYVGVTPQYSPRYTGDGLQTLYNTPASEAMDPPPPTLVVGETFEITIDGIKLRHDIDFTIESNPLSPNYGKCTFTVPPADQSKIDIVWFAPIVVDIFSETNVTATISSITHTIAEWVGEFGKDIIIQATGTTAYKSLGDRFRDNANYFLHIADMVANTDLYQPGAVCVVKGQNTAGDGFFANYFIKTEAEAIADGDDYTTPGTPNIFIPVVNWVAVYQIQDLRLLSADTKVLADGQTIVNWATDVSIGSVHISGPDVDDGKLIEGTDFTLDGTGTIMTLAESAPAGTVLILTWYQQDNPTNLAPGTIDIIDDDGFVASAASLKFIGADVKAQQSVSVANQVEVYIPPPVLSGSGDTVPATANAGDTVPSVTLNWEYLPPGVTVVNQTVTGSTLGNIPVNDIDRSVVIAGPITDTEVFTIYGETQFGNISFDVTLEFQEAIFFGKSVSDTLIEAEILALTQLDSNDHTREYNFAAGAGYLWICYPQSLGLLTQWDNLNAIGDVITYAPVQQIVVDPGTGTPTPYYAQRSSFQLNGAMDVETYS